MELLHACCRSSTQSLSRLLPPSSEEKWPQDSEGKVKKKTKTSICYQYFHLHFTEARGVRGLEETTGSKR